MEHDFPDLVPLFVSEARERLDRLSLLSGTLEDDVQALADARRELHTLKGAGRMMRLTGFAELCHGAETLLKSLPADGGPLLVRAVDRLVQMVDALAGGEDPGADPELVALLEGRPDPVEGAPPAPVPREPATSPPALPPPPRPGVAAAPTIVAGPRVEPPSVEGGASAVASSGPAPPVAGELRLEAAQVDGLAERATRLRILARGAEPFAGRLYELADFAEQGVREPTPAQVLALLASNLRRTAVALEGAQRRVRRLAEQQLDEILDLQLQPLRPFLLSLARHARELARSLGREVEVTLEGEDTRLDRRITRELEEAMLHLVHNAVDHGIEAPPARRAAGKAEVGALTIAAATEGSRVLLAVADDGNGVDEAAVAAAAVRAGLLSDEEAAAAGRDELLHLLFRPGFTTRTEVSAVSGRGVGLDAVWSAATRVDGELRVESEPGRGTRVSVAVPLARRGEHVLLLRVGRLRVGLPHGVIERVTRLLPAEVVVRGAQRLCRRGDGLIPYASLAELLGEVAAAQPLLLEGRVSGQPLAVEVDAVDGEEEVLVRPPGRLLAGSELIVGTAISAGGEPVVLLSASRLARVDALPAPLAPRSRSAVRRLVVLLVDDSLVTREMERRLLVDAGFEVVAAANAHDALTHLAERAFACVVTDIEMPGMDGLELTRQLRAVPHFANLPVVVVSTRDRAEDRLQGLAAGADAYLTKQGLDAGELVAVVRRLGSPS